MSLISCPECHKKSSITVGKCVHCGYQFKAGESLKIKKEESKTSKAGFVVVLIVGALIWYTCSRDGDSIEQDVDNAKLSQSQKDSIKHIKNIESQFSAWSGEHLNSVKMIKESMNDPDSYKHVKTVYIDRGNDGMRIITKCRGSNLYGAIVTQSFVTLVDTAGNVTDFKQLDYNT